MFEDEQGFENRNWMQFFSPERLSREIREAGFSSIQLFGSLNLEPISDNGNEIGVVVHKA